MAPKPRCPQRCPQGSPPLPPFATPGVSPAGSPQRAPCASSRPPGAAPSPGGASGSASRRSCGPGGGQRGRAAAAARAPLGERKGEPSEEQKPPGGGGRRGEERKQRGQGRPSSATVGGDRTGHGVTRARLSRRNAAEAGLGASRTPGGRNPFLVWDATVDQQGSGGGRAQLLTKASRVALPSPSCCLGLGGPPEARKPEALPSS